MPVLTATAARWMTDSQLLALRGRAIATQDDDLRAVLDAELDTR